MNKKDFKSVSEYADEKKISVQAVYQAIKRGSLNSVKLGGYIFVVPKK